MKPGRLPQVDDIISSPKFAYGYRDSGKTCICVDGTTTVRPVGRYMDEEDRVALAAKTGKIPPKYIQEETGLYDSTRGQARFIVETARSQGGGGCGQNDPIPYPDGWYVLARRLNDDGTFNPAGEVIAFYMTGNFTCMVKPEDVKIVGEMIFD
jgi:hypothetical protein